jgi:hypothetical protein
VATRRRHGKWKTEMLRLSKESLLGEANCRDDPISKGKHHNYPSGHIGCQWRSGPSNDAGESKADRKTVMLRFFPFVTYSLTISQPPPTTLFPALNFAFHKKIGHCHYSPHRGWAPEREGHPAAQRLH